MIVANPATTSLLEALGPKLRRQRRRLGLTLDELAGRTGIYDITVTNQEGRRIALFRGRSHRIQGEVIPASPSQSQAG